MVRADWYKLDNVGKFYASQAGRGGQTVFRFCATMADPVDPSALQAAVDQAVERYPGFNVRLRSGLFWHYLEPAQEPPCVQPENLPICANLHSDVTSVLMRVSWHGNRINLEISHIIADGRGTMELFNTLLGAYVAIRHHAPVRQVVDSVPAQRRAEDSYTANFEPKKAGSGKRVKNYRMAAWKNSAEPTFMEFHLSANAVHAKAKSMGVSVTSLVIAAVIVSIRQTMPASKRNRAIHMDIPVDLRATFGSDTLRNFFGLAYVSYTPGAVDQSLEDIARNVQVQLKDATRPEELKRRMNRMLKLEKNPALRVAPVFLKDGALMLADMMSAREVTTTVSGIGRIPMDPAVQPYVRNINLFTSTRGFNVLFCTFDDDLSVTFSSVYINHDVERNFVRLFAQMGIEGTINMNKDAQQVDDDLRLTQLEKLLDLDKSRARRKKRAKKRALADKAKRTNCANRAQDAKGAPDAWVARGTQDAWGARDAKGARGAKSAWGAREAWGAQGTQSGSLVQPAKPAQPIEPAGATEPARPAQPASLKGGDAR